MDIEHEEVLDSEEIAVECVYEVQPEDGSVFYYLEALLPILSPEGFSLGYLVGKTSLYLHGEE